jgi:hypothetical protein
LAERGRRQSHQNELTLLRQQASNLTDELKRIQERIEQIEHA